MEKSRYTLKELSKDLEVSVRTLREWVNKGILKASKVGRAYLVTSNDLEKFKKSNVIAAKKNAKSNKCTTRNYLCRNYDTCLYDAARENKNFDCEECGRFARADKQEISTHELAGMLSLWESVLGSEVYLR